MTMQPDNAVQHPVDHPTHPLLWSLRRELWENRFIYLAPLAVSCFVLFAASISTMVTYGRRMRTLGQLDPAKQHAAIVGPFSIPPAVIMFTTIIVALFYCVDALYSERRDRSILFWKSLPVSDRTVVLSKAIVPIAVLPSIAFVLSWFAATTLVVLNTMALMGRGMSPVRLLSEYHFVQEPVVAFYGLTVHALWLAPIYCWLLLISAWARRSPFLWAVLPPFALVAFERIAFHSFHFAHFVAYRWMGAMDAAFVLHKVPPGHVPLIDRMSQLDPVGYLTTPGLWFGLLFAALFLAAAIKLRHDRAPL